MELKIEEPVILEKKRTRDDFNDLPELIELKKVYKSINAKILGVVLNRVKKHDIRYGSYNYYYSSYYSSYFKDQER